MPLFKCSKCHCIENTACGCYWMQHADGEPVLCSECGDGKWHGKFQKRHAEGMRVGADGFLYELTYTPTHTKLVGVVTADGSVSTATGERDERGI